MNWIELCNLCDINEFKFNMTAISVQNLHFFH